jgi:hypothetical protein
MTLYTIKTQSPVEEIITNRTFDNKTEEMETKNRIRLAEIERKAAKKIISYILLFILQWLPVQINIIIRLASTVKKKKKDILYIIIISCLFIFQNFLI